MKKKIKMGMNVGITSIIVIFTLLGLVIFSALALVSANADYKLSEKYANHTTDYYQASNQAEDINHTMESALTDLFSSVSGKEDYFAQIESTIAVALADSFEDQSGYTLEVDEEQAFISYVLPVNDKQNLEIKLQILYPENTGDYYYQVLTWKTVSAEEWQADNHLNVLGGS